MKNNEKETDKNKVVVERLINVSHWICKIVYDWKNFNSILKNNVNFFKENGIFQDYYFFSLYIQEYYYLSFCIKMRDCVTLFQKMVNFSIFTKFIDQKTTFLKKIKNLDTSKIKTFFSFPFHNYYYFDKPKYEEEYWEKRKKFNLIIKECNVDDVIQDFNKIFNQYINKNSSFSREQIKIDKKIIISNQLITDFIKKIIGLIKS